MAGSNQEEVAGVCEQVLQVPAQVTLPIVTTLKDALDEAKARLSQLEEDRPFSAPKKKRKTKLRRPEGVFRMNVEDGSSAREEAELSRFLKDFKRESKLVPSTIKIQSWCRMRRIRQRYQRCFVARKRSTTQECWRRWVLYTCMSKYSVRAQTRLYFVRWLNLTTEEKELRSLWQRMLTMGSHHAERGLMKLFSWATRTLKKPTQPSEKFKVVSNLVSSLPQKFDAIILKAFFNSWTQYLRTKIRHRKLASVHLQRARRLGGKKMWAPERVKLSLVMWYRYTLFKKRKRANEALPVFDDSIAEWTCFMERYLYLKEKEVEADKRAPTAIKRRTLCEWIKWVALQQQLRELEKLARAHYSSTIKGKLLIAWNRFTKERGKKMRSVRRCLVSWGLWAKRKKRNNAIKRTIISNVLTHGKLMVLKYWHGKTVHALNRSLVCHQKFMREKYLPTLKVVMALKDQRIHVVYLGIWQKWSQLAKRRVRWNKVLFILAQQSLFDRMKYAWQKLADRCVKASPKFTGEVSKRDKEKLRDLLLSGAELESNTSEEESATTKLLHAVSTGDLSTCVSLVKSKAANISAKTASGQSLLHTAVRTFSAKQVPVVLLLLKVGLSPELKDQNGDTPRSLAVHPQVAYLLETHVRRIREMSFLRPELSWYRRTYVRKYFSIVSRWEIWQYLFCQLKSVVPTGPGITLAVYVDQKKMTLDEYRSCVAARCRGLSKRIERDQLLLRRHFIRQGFAAYNSDAEKRLPLPHLDLGACYPLSNTCTGEEVNSAYGFVVSQIPNETRLLQLEDEIAAVPEAQEIEGNALWEDAVYLWEIDISRGDQIDAWERCCRAYDAYLETLYSQTPVLMQDLRNLELEHQRSSAVHQRKQEELALLQEARESSAREILTKTNRHQHQRSSQLERKVLLKKQLSSARGTVSRYERELAECKEKLRRNRKKETQLNQKIEQARDEVDKCERQLYQVTEVLKNMDVVYQRHCHANFEAMQVHAKDEERLKAEVCKCSEDEAAMLARMTQRAAEQQEHALGIALIEKRRDKARCYAEDPLQYYTEEEGEQDVGETRSECDVVNAESTTETDRSQECEAIESWIAKGSSSDESSEDGSVDDKDEGEDDSSQQQKLTMNEIGREQDETLVAPLCLEDPRDSASVETETREAGSKKSFSFNEQAYWKAKNRQLPKHQDPLLELTLPPDQESENIQTLMEDIKKAEEAKTREFMENAGLLVARDANNCFDEEKTQKNFEKLYARSKRLVFNGELLKLQKVKKKASPLSGHGLVDELEKTDPVPPANDYDLSSIETESTSAEFSDDESECSSYLFGNFVGKRRQACTHSQSKALQGRPYLRGKDLEFMWKQVEGSCAVDTKSFCSADEMKRVEEMAKQTSTHDFCPEVSTSSEMPNRLVEFDFEISPIATSTSDSPCNPALQTITQTLVEKAKHAQEPGTSATLAKDEVAEESEIEVETSGVVDDKDLTGEKRIRLKVAIRDGDDELDVSYSVDESSSECSQVGFGQDGMVESDICVYEDENEDESLTKLVLAKLRQNQSVLQSKPSLKRGRLHPKTRHKKLKLEPLDCGPFISKLREVSPLGNRHIVFDPFFKRSRSEVVLGKGAKRVRQRRRESSQGEICPSELHLSVGPTNRNKPKRERSDLNPAPILDTLPPVMPTLQPLFPPKSTAKVKDVQGLQLEQKINVKSSE